MAPIGVVDLLLHGPNTLAPGDRELIATYVSAVNGCVYCQTIHGALAARYLDGGEKVIAEIKRDFQNAPIPEKLKALLAIAGKLNGGEKSIKSRDINRARQLGATDLEIHDTVLIAKMFYMCNDRGSARSARSRRPLPLKRQQRRASGAKNRSPA